MGGWPCRYCHTDVWSCVSQGLISGRNILLAQWVLWEMGTLPTASEQGLCRPSNLPLDPPSRGGAGTSPAGFALPARGCTQLGDALAEMWRKVWIYSSAPSKELSAAPLPGLLPEVDKPIDRIGVS